VNGAQWWERESEKRWVRGGQTECHIGWKEGLMRRAAEVETVT